MRKLAIRCSPWKKKQSGPKLFWAGCVVLGKYVFASGKREPGWAPPLIRQVGPGPTCRRLPSSSPFFSFFFFLFLYLLSSSRVDHARESFARLGPARPPPAATALVRAAGRRDAGRATPSRCLRRGRPRARGEPRRRRHGSVLGELAAGGSRRGTRPRATISHKKLSGRKRGPRGTPPRLESREGSAWSSPWSADRRRRPWPERSRAPPSRG